MIAAERERQLAEKGWTPQHDDEHSDGELAYAAESYAFAAACQSHGDGVPPGMLHSRVPNHWPPAWSEDWWKPSEDPIRNLSKAGALIAAEIDRLIRAQA